MERMLQVLLVLLIVQASVTAQYDQGPGVPVFLQNTFFTSQNRIAVPDIPNSVSQPALNDPAFSAIQLPVRSSLGATFSSLGQIPSLGLQQRPASLVPQFPHTFEGSQVPSMRIGKAIESGFVSKPQQSPSAPAPFNQLSPGLKLPTSTQQESGFPQADPSTFSQFSSGPDVSQQSLQDSLGQALDQASRSAQFSVSKNPSPVPTQGSANIGHPSSTRIRGGFFTRQEPGSRQGSQPQQLSTQSSSQRPDSGSTFSEPFAGSFQSRPAVPSPASFSQFGPPRSPSTQFSSGSPLSRPPQLDLDQALTKASEAAAAGSPQVPSKSLPFRKQVFEAIPAQNDIDRTQTFRLDTKKELLQNGSPPGSRIVLTRTQVSKTPKSTPSLSSSSVSEVSRTKSCTKSFTSECHNEYSMVCEDTFTERDKYECRTVEETVCDKGFTTEYEPACFQQILSQCENICKRGAQPDCTPQCARSLGRTSCHKVKVVTPHTTCTKVPNEVCENIKKKVPYEKCRDVPKKVCVQVPREVCR